MSVAETEIARTEAGPVPKRAAERVRAAGDRQRRSIINATTVEVKVPGELLGYLRMEAKIGPRALLYAVARVLMWGEDRHAGAKVVRLPIEDVEAILDGATTLVDRMEADGEDVTRVKTLRFRIEQMRERVEKKGWAVSGPRPSGHRLVRKEG